MNSQHELDVEIEPGSLERMLNNPRVSDEEIILALIREYLEQAYQIALQREPNPQLARRAACQALAQVVNQRQSYWGESPLEDRLQELVNHLLTVKKKNSQRLPVESETGNAEGVSPQTAVEQALAELRRSARRSSQLRKGLFSISGLGVVVLLLWLAGINQLFTTPNPFSRVRFTYPYITQPGDTLESIAIKAGIKANDIHANQDETLTKPLSPGITLLLPSLKPGLWQTLFPRKAEYPPVPLTLNSTPSEIKQRILDSPRYWQTLWVERITMNYGPPGYIGPPFFVNRQQIWLRQPGQGLMLEGGVRDSQILMATYFDSNRIYQTPTGSMGSISTIFLGDAKRESPSWKADILFMPYFFTEEWVVEPIGLEAVAGRETLVVDQINADGWRMARLWVDTRLGVVLAVRQYSESYNDTEHQAVWEDQIVLTIQFGVKIPEAILDPNNRPDKFLKDVKGNPLITPNITKPTALKFAPDPVSISIDHIPPPASFKVNQSRLTLRLQTLPSDNPFDENDYGSSADGQNRKVVVFGDDYYLGTLSLDSTGWVYIDFCKRSPNGELVLFDQLAADRKTYWMRLSDTQNIHNLPEGLNSPNLFAFSPSSRQLAYYRCSVDLRWCGISLVNIETGEISRFIETPDQMVNWLAYSPDGNSLAMITYSTFSSSTSSNTSLKIYNLSNAKNTYTGAFDTQTGKAAADAPTQTWGAAFQPFANWSEGCDAP